MIDNWSMIRLMPSMPVFVATSLRTIVSMPMRMRWRMWRSWLSSVPIIIPWVIWVPWFRSSVLITRSRASSVVFGGIVVPAVAFARTSFSVRPAFSFALIFLFFLFFFFNLSVFDAFLVSHLLLVFGISLFQLFLDLLLNGNGHSWEQSGEPVQFAKHVPTHLSDCHWLSTSCFGVDLFLVIKKRFEPVEQVFGRLCEAYVHKAERSDIRRILVSYQTIDLLSGQF